MLTPQSNDEAIAFSILKQLRDHHADSLKTLIIQEKEKSEINRESFLLLRNLGEKAYPEKTRNEIMMILIEVRVQLRKIVGLPRLTVTVS